MNRILGETFEQDQFNRWVEKAEYPNGVTLWNRKGWNGNGFGTFSFWVAADVNGTIIGTFGVDNGSKYRSFVGHHVSFDTTFTAWKKMVRDYSPKVEAR